MNSTARQKQYKRTPISRLALSEALLALMEEMPISRITVSMLCEKASVHRSTFYVHYQDIYSLLDEIEQGLYQEIERIIGCTNESKPTPSLLRNLYEVVDKNRSLCRVLFGKYGDPSFLRSIGNIHRDTMINRWKQFVPPQDHHMLEYIHAFSSYTSIGIIEKWVTGNHPETAEELAQIASRLIMNGINAILS